ncbi:restriction endonuclease subunit S [Francisella philomiragia]|uniref:restriction endonuclease subunit S n=1 Tax=Francisella philomiragia TaxID=28110 RepID=UPI0035182BD4
MSELYKLPAGWEWKKLGEVSKKIFAGGDKPDQVSEYSTKELPIPIYANGVKNDGLYGYSNVYKVDEECVTISARGTIGYSVVRNEKFLPIVRLIVVIPNLDLLSKFLKNYLDFEIVSNTGSSIPQLTVPAVKSIQIPLPPLAEQKRIVAKLDSLFEKIDKAIELHQQNITNANTLMASTLDKTFKKLKTYEWCKLGDRKVCNLIMGQSPDSKSYNFNGIGMPFFQGKKEFGDLYPTVEQYTTEPKKVAEKGDILLSVRAPVGPTNIANIQCCIGRGLSAISPNKDNSLTNYLLYFFRNFELLISNKGKGSTFSAITKKDLEDIHVPLPPLPIQQQTVEYLDSIATKVDKIKQLNEQKLENLKALKASILDKAFRGEL